MTLTNLKIVRVVCRCNLNRTCSKFFIYIVICYNRNLFVNQRQNYILSYQLFIALIIRMYCDRSISKHCLRTGCCDLNTFICSNDRIVNMPEMSCLILVFYLCIRNRCLTYRTPVDNSWALINISLFVKADKYFLYCFRTAFIHCKTFSVPISGRTKLL